MNINMDILSEIFVKNVSMTIILIILSIRELKGESFNIKSDAQALRFFRTNFLIPLIFIPINFSEFLGFFANVPLNSAPYYFLFLLCGTIIGIALAPKTNYKPHTNQKVIVREGTWFPLIATIFLISLGIYIQYQQLVLSEPLNDLQMIQTAALAIFVGNYLGRGLFYIYTFYKNERIG